MSKLLLTISLLIITGSFHTAGSFQIDNYKVYWIRVGEELLMIDSDDWCLFNNDGIPRDCNAKEKKTIKNYFKL